MCLDWGVGKDIRFTHILIPSDVANIRQRKTADTNGHEGRRAAGALVVRVLVFVDALHGGVDTSCDAEGGGGEGEDCDAEEEGDEGVLEEEALEMVC